MTINNCLMTIKQAAIAKNQQKRKRTKAKKKGVIKRKSKKDIVDEKNKEQRIQKMKICHQKLENQQRNHEFYQRMRMMLNAKNDNAFDQNNDIQIISTLSLYEKIFLTAMVIQNVWKECSFGSTKTYRHAFNKYIKKRLGDSEMNNVHFRNMLERLKDIGIITTCFRNERNKEYIRLEVNISEAVHALKEHELCNKILHKYIRK